MLIYKKTNTMHSLIHKHLLHLLLYRLCCSYLLHLSGHFIHKTGIMPRRLLRTDLACSLNNYMATVNSKNGLGNEPLVRNENTFGISTTVTPYDASPSSNNMVSHFRQNISQDHTCSAKRAFHATSSYNSSQVLEPQSKKPRSSEICGDQHFQSDYVSIAAENTFNLKTGNKNCQFITTSGSIHQNYNLH